jgi:hypothetical protein
MSDEFDCPGCAAHLTERQLRMTSVVKETCPRCGTIIRQGNAFRYGNTEAIIAEDVDAIDIWLTAEKQGLRFEYQQLRDREAQGEYLWRATGAPLAGCPDNWGIEVFYATKSPGIMAVRVTATEAQYLDDDVTGPLMGVFRGHGLQPHGTRGSGAGLAGPHEVTRWGGQQYLNTDTLGAGLLQPVLNRLITAMRDALAMRNQGGGAAP